MLPDELNQVEPLLNLLGPCVSRDTESELRFYIYQAVSPTLGSDANQSINYQKPPDRDRVTHTPDGVPIFRSFSKSDIHGRCGNLPGAIKEEICDAAEVLLIECGHTIEDDLNAT